jgi:hypothetical protein
MEVGLGRFGDRRLQKGGSFYRLALLKLGAVVFVYVALAAIGLGKSG